MTITAEISSDTIASVTGSTIAAIGSSPVLALCRKLLDAGVDPTTPLDCYRGTTPALHVRSIGEAANLEVEGIGFRPATRRGRGSPVSQIQPAGVLLPSSA
jgi:hypothetical protein